PRGTETAFDTSGRRCPSAREGPFPWERKNVQPPAVSSALHAQHFPTAATAGLFPCEPKASWNCQSRPAARVPDPVYESGRFQPAA
ncbi:hypothetical protein IscW_ISCW022482, partial [Ixodes scapularis]